MDRTDQAGNLVILKDDVGERIRNKAEVSQQRRLQLTGSSHHAWSAGTTSSRRGTIIALFITENSWGGRNKKQTWTCMTRKDPVRLVGGRVGLEPDDPRVRIRGSRRDWGQGARTFKAFSRDKQRRGLSERETSTLSQTSRTTGGLSRLTT